MSGALMNNEKALLGAAQAGLFAPYPFARDDVRRKVEGLGDAEAADTALKGLAAKGLLRVAKAKTFGAGRVKMTYLLAPQRIAAEAPPVDDRPHVSDEAKAATLLAVAERAESHWREHIVARVYARNINIELTDILRGVKPLARAGQTYGTWAVSNDNVSFFPDGGSTAGVYELRYVELVDRNNNI